MQVILRFAVLPDGLSDSVWVWRDAFYWLLKHSVCRIRAIGSDKIFPTWHAQKPSSVATHSPHSCHILLQNDLRQQ
jgi:hypothetical protein